MTTLAPPVPSHTARLPQLFRAIFRKDSRPALGRSPRQGVYRPSPSGAPPSRRPGQPRGSRLTGWLNRNRRLAVALLLCVAAGITVEQLTPAPDDAVDALAAARDLPAGKTLGRADLAVLRIPRRLLPGGSVSDSSLLQGKQLAIALRQGQLLSDTQLLGPGLLAGNPPGSAAVPLRMADPSSVQLLSPGQLINVVLSGGNSFEQPTTSQVLAAAVPVLWTSVQGGKGAQWLGDGETDGLIVVAADAAQSRRLAGASTEGRLFFVLVAPAPD